MIVISAAAETVRRLRRELNRLQHRSMATIDGFQLKVPRPTISSELSELILSGSYDIGDRTLIKKHLRSGDRVVEFGTGCGITAMVARRVVGATGSVLTIEADPGIHQLARGNFALNGLDIDARHGAVVPDPSISSVDFYQSKHFWGSNITGFGRESAKRLKVPAVNAGDVARRSDGRRQVLICDVEGYETTLFRDGTLIDCFDLILMEIHHYSSPPKADGEELAAMFERLHDAGRRIIDIEGHTFVFQRTP